MASIINADNGVVSGSAGLKTSADSTGVLALQTNGTTAVTVDTSQNATFNSTGGLTLPKGTTAQRPSSPVIAQTRFNTESNIVEVWMGTAWGVLTPIINYTIEYLIVAGGGGGGSKRGGGGGAGGYYTGTLTVLPTSGYPITIGGGGNGSSAGLNNATNGVNSTAFSQTAIGGGRGAGYDTTLLANGVSGGSGGGAARGETSAPSSTGGAGTAGQGNAGGNSNASFSNGAGGGGAGSAGSAPPSGVGGAGGAGLNWQSLGTFYAGGGGGGAATTADAGGAGGNGGGGYGGGASPSPMNDGTAGTANRGGGGGGAGDAPTFVGGNGGSGVVILRYSGVQRGAGGTVVTTGGFTYHTFTASGTYVA